MSKARFILVALLCASPAILLWDGLVVQGLVAGVVALTLAIIAQSLRPGETEFLVATIRPIAVVATVPALWVVIQVLPLKAMAHPIWTSLETALGRPVTGSISIDPGASIVALGQYICMTGIVLATAAVAVDRQRAEWILFALTGAAAAFALILLADKLLYSGAGLAPLKKAEALDCAGIGAIIATAACIRTVERSKTRHKHARRSAPTLIGTFAASGAALAICAAALIFTGSSEVIFAAGCGVAALACMMIIRRLRLGAWYALMIGAAIICASILFITAQPIQPAKSPLLAFAALPISTSERMLQDAPIVGTGAGTFAGLAPVYHEMDDASFRPVPATTAAAFAIELGQPILWLVAIATIGFIIALLRASVQRGRDSFYAAMGGSCFIALTLLGLMNAGLLATAVGLMAAASLGLALAQSKSRSVRP